MHIAPTRRAILATGAGLVSFALARPARATPDEMTAAVREFTGGAGARAGRVRMEVAPLVENGNAVPLTLRVVSAMTAADHVRRLAVFNEKNPRPGCAVFYLGPRAGRAVVSTRLRLATSQTLTAIAEMSDGSFWSDSAEVVVTIAACTEDL